MPVDCDSGVRNLLKLPTPCLVMVHGLGIYSLSGAPFTVTKHVQHIDSLAYCNACEEL